MNWLVVVAVVAAFGLQIAAIVQQLDQSAMGPVEEAAGTIDRFVLHGWSLTGLFGYMWLHGGLFHLIGNLIFLWLFGNAVCSKIGNVLYLPVYIGLGLIAGMSHLIFTGGAVIGASGAINGIVGMYLVFFPENSISCFFLLFIKPITFSVSGYWMILLWFVLDIWGAMKGGQGVAYFAHIGGFAAGFGLAILMLKTKWIVMERDEKSLLELLDWEKKKVPEEPRRDFASWQQQWAKSETEKPQPLTIPMEPEKPKEQFIRFRCRCGQKIKVPQKHAGRIGRCPKCSTRVKVPERQAETGKKTQPRITKNDGG